MTKTIIADSQSMIREGIKSCLKDSIEVVGEVNNGQELLSMLDRRQAEVVIVDTHFPDTDGIELIEHLHHQYPDLKILVFSSFENEKYIRQAIDAGASGYILKNADKDELIHAVHSVCAGNPYIFSEIALKLLQKIAPSVLCDTSPETKAGTSEYIPEKLPDGLSRREVQVLQLIAEGYTNMEIAEKLFTSKRTIDGHRQNLIEKTQSKNTAALIRYALGKGLVR